MGNNSQKILSEFISKLPASQAGIADHILTLVSRNYDLDYAIKWNQLTFTVNRDFHHWLFGLKSTKKNIGIVFHFGGLLEDRKNVFIKGESIFFRKLEFENIESVEWETINDFIQQALSKLDYFKANWRSLNKK